MHAFTNHCVAIDIIVTLFCCFFLIYIVLLFFSHSQKRVYLMKYDYSCKMATKVISCFTMQFLVHWWFCNAISVICI